MDITTFFPLISALFVFMLVLIVTLRGGKIRTNFTFVLFSIAIMIWMIGTFMMFLDKSSISQVLFWDKFVYVGVVFIPAIMYHFGLSLTDDTSKWKKFVLGLGYVISTCFLILIPTKLFIDGAFVYSWGAHSKAQPLHAVFLVYFVTYLFLWFRMVSAYYKRVTDPLELSKIRLVFFSFAILACFGSLGFLPAYGISIYPFSYLSGVVFVAVLAYTIFKFQLFNIRIIAAELLTFMIWVIIFIQLVMTDTVQGKFLGGIVLFCVSILGIFLIQSVNREAKQLEKIEKLAKDLETTNGQQEGLLHFIGHEVKGFLTKDSGAFASLLDGDFAPIPEVLKPFVDHSLTESRRGVEAVTNILKASNLKKGTVTYTKEPFDLKALVAESVERAKPAAEQKGLALSFVTDDSSYQIIGDKAQIGEHVLRNLIDNAINYTPSGSIAVSLKKENGSSTGLGTGKFIFAVKDTGIGISEEDKKRLFTEGGHGKDSQKINVNSTGYGLFIAKKITEAHNGTIHAESAGEGKGSTFIVEFPAE